MSAWFCTIVSVHRCFKQACNIFYMTSSIQRSLQHPYRCISACTIKFLCLLFIPVDSIIRTDAQDAVPRGTLLKPLVHVPSFRQLVSSDPARVTTGSTHDLLDMVSQFLTSYYTSRSVQKCESYLLFCLERQAFSGTSGHFLIWVLPSAFGNAPLSLGTSFDWSFPLVKALHESRTQVIERRQNTDAQFGRVLLSTLPVVALANLLCTHRVLSLFLWRIGFSLLALWIQLMLLSVLRGFRYLYGIDMASC